MKTYRSRFALILAVLHLIVSVVIMGRVYGCTDSSYLGCDAPLALVALPALPILLLLDQMEIWTVRFSSPGPRFTDVVLTVLSVLFSAVIVYLAGTALELGWRFARRTH